MRKIIGAVLIVLGVVVTTLIVSNGMLLPHIVGPLILVTAGVVLLTVKGSASQSAGS